MSLPKKPAQLRRRLTRAAVAGALIVLPLGALAATASADTQDPTTAAVAPADQDGADISGHPHGPGWQHRDKPGEEFRGPHHHRGDGPRRGPSDDRPQPDAPQQFQQLLPPTGSG